MLMKVEGSPESPGRLVMKVEVVPGEGAYYTSYQKNKALIIQGPNPVATLAVEVAVLLLTRAGASHRSPSISWPPPQSLVPP
jgi:hypothetical protein